MFIVGLSDLANKDAEFDIEFIDRWHTFDEENSSKPILVRFVKTLDSFPDMKFVLVLENENQNQQSAVGKAKQCKLEIYSEEEQWATQYRDIFQIICPTKDEIWELDFLAQYKRILEANRSNFETTELQKALKIIMHYLSNKMEGKINNAY